MEDKTKKDNRSPEKRPNIADSIDLTKHSNPPANPPEDIVEELIEEEYVEMPFPPQMGMPPFPPPPQMGRYPFPPKGAMPFPPPPQTGRPPFPPPWQPINDISYETYEESYEGDSENKNDYYEEPRFFPTQEAAPTPLSISDAKERHKSINKMRSAAADKLLENGELAAKNNKESDFVKFLSVCAKVVISLFVLGMLTIICLLIIFTYRQEINKKGIETQKTAAATKVSGGDYTWKMGSGAGALCIRAFYENIGNWAVVTEAKDFLMRGTVEMKGKKEDFYCIRKLEDSSFLKIGENKTARAYLIGNFGDGAIRLLGGGMMGKKQQMGDSEALVIRAMVSFDNLLFNRAFSNKNEQISRIGTSYVEYLGRSQIKGVDFDSIAIYEGDCKILYYFDGGTHRLFVCEYITPTLKIRVEFDKYTELDSGYIVPAIRSVYVDGKLFARVNIDFIARSSGIFFPR